MARFVNETEHSLKRNEILDSAWKLIYLKGFDQMSIQHILDDLQISKGAFYHYFSSKADLLEAMVDRLTCQGMEVILPIVQAPNLTALEKFRSYFDTAVRWKTGQKDYLLALIRGWYKDDNVVIRQKSFDVAIRRVAPLFTAIIQQGVQEGVFQISNPDQTSEIIFSLFQNFGNAFTRLFLQVEQEPDDLKRSQLWRDLIRTMTAYSEAMERVLGAPTGSMKFMEPEDLKEWIDLPVDDPTGSADPVVAELGSQEAQAR